MLPPRPRANRATIDTPQNAMSARRSQLNGVSSFWRSGSNSTWWPWSRSARRDRVRALPEEGVDGAERGADRHDGGRHGPERRRGEPRKRLLPVRREPELLERHRREVQHGRAAHLLLSVDVVDVLVRAVLDALVGEREHLVAGSVAQGVRRARLDARRGRDRLEEPLGLVRGRRLPVERDRRRLAGAVGAVRALVDLRRELVPLRGRHVPRTGEHAVPAADALGGVVGHRPVGLPVQRRRRTGRDAAGLQAVEAPPHHVGGVQAARLLRDSPSRGTRSACTSSADSVAGFWNPRWARSSVSSPSRSFHCLQATWQARQPMQLVMSISVVRIGTREPRRSASSCPPLFPGARRAARRLDHVDQAGLRLLRSRAGIRWRRS